MSEEKLCQVCHKDKCSCEQDFIEQYDNCYCYDEKGEWKR